MCPKYASGGSEYDAKSENFSFGIVLLELLLGRLQGNRENDLYGIYIDEETPISNDLDMRAGPWIPECAEQLEALARECLSKYSKRIATMMAVMRRLVELEKEFCRATAEIVRLTRLAEEMKRESEALRFEAATQAGAREREQQQLHLLRGFPVSAGLGCESIAGHKGSSSSAAFATTFSPYLLVFGARALLVTSSVPIVLRVRYRGFWRQYRRQNLWRDTERKGAASCVCCRAVKHRTPSRRSRAVCLTRSSGNTARHRMLWWSSGCLRSCNSAFMSNSKLQDASLKMQTMLPGQSKVQLRLQNSFVYSIPTQCSALVAVQGL
jgi:hypothetical protein